MLGPYAYTPPIYWFTDTILGGAYGFNTETGPGAQVPTIESLKKMLPEDELWPIGDAWNYHCGRYEFADLSRFNKAIKERYGDPKSLEEFDLKAQAMNYELMRPMFEAFQVNKERATGVVQWMLNAAWPKMYWQLYDYYLMPTGAFYGTQKSCKPLHVIYNYGDNNIYLINDYLKSIENLKVQVRAYDIESNILFDETKILNAGEDSSNKVLEIPELENITKTYFLDLRLHDSDGNEVSNNFYWLSTKEDVLDYEANIGEFGFYTPSKEYADFTSLNSQPQADVSVKHTFELIENKQKVTVELKNNSDKIAFMINLKVVNKGNGEIILPVFWEDNFISLLPGEVRTISAKFNTTEDAELKISGWNLQ
jgi:exo-1,4-beta-D-glucosaminidase